MTIITRADEYKLSPPDKNELAICESLAVVYCLYTSYSSESLNRYQTMIQSGKYSIPTVCIHKGNLTHAVRR